MNGHARPASLQRMQVLMAILAFILLLSPFVFTATLAATHCVTWWMAAALGAALDMAIVWSLSDGGSR